MQQMLDEAMDCGACLLVIWGWFYLKVTDEGNWYFVDCKEHKINETEAARLYAWATTGFAD